MANTAKQPPEASSLRYLSIADIDRMQLRRFSRFELDPLNARKPLGYFAAADVYLIHIALGLLNVPGQIVACVTESG